MNVHFNGLPWISLFARQCPCSPRVNWLHNPRPASHVVERPCDHGTGAALSPPQTGRRWITLSGGNEVSTRSLGRSTVAHSRSSSDTAFCFGWHETDGFRLWSSEVRGEMFQAEVMRYTRNFGPDRSWISICQLLYCEGITLNSGNFKVIVLPLPLTRPLVYPTED